MTAIASRKTISSNYLVWTIIDCTLRTAFLKLEAWLSRLFDGFVSILSPAFLLKKGKILTLSLSSHRKSQLVEDRKIYVRRVSSNVCDLRKASRPLSTTTSTAVNEPGAGLFETFLEVALFYDRHQHLHTPYIKSSYPNSVTVRFPNCFFA